MKILTRYMIRAHSGPFLFAFTAVTGLLFLNAVAQRLENFAGKGLEWTVIGEFMLLSFPHIVALTFPMAILVAVLYTFSDMTSQNEVTAMAAGGVHPLRMLVPLLGVGLILSVGMFLFNDRVLPESNHRLSSLLSDVGSKSPTFELREDVVNEVHTGDDSRYFLRARSIDPVTNRMGDVEIFDLSQVGESRTIVARRGDMGFTADRSDLYLTLEDGVIYETSRDRPGAFQRVEFETQIMPFRGVGAELERRTGGSRRGEREMSVEMLQGRVEDNLKNLREVGDESLQISVEAVREALGLGRATDPETLLDREEIESQLAREVDDVELAIPPPSPGFGIRDGGFEGVINAYRVNLARWNVHRNASYRYRVEIHKKYAIAFACMVFILLGPPLATRFPRGGAGMAIAGSVGIFFFYWMGLIGGERFADRGQMNPVLAMWLPNAILTVIALYLLKHMARQISTNRGGAWDEIRFRVGRWVARIRRRKGPTPAPGGGG
jgi:lipopolysaccharide export system permease protein